MEQVLWPIDFAFPFPADCSQEQLVALLEKQATQWPGWDNFPWCVTRNMHQFISRPPANFHYLMTHHCLTGYAAHLVLTSKFENRQSVLALILREKFEIAGMLRALLLDAVHAEMHRTNLPFILDCSGPDDGCTYAPAEELEQRRQSFRACIEDAVRDFVMILNLASQRIPMTGRLLGHSMQLWARGADMPEAMTVPVQVEVTSSGKVVRPSEAERVAFLETGMSVPWLVVGKRKAEGCRLKTEGDSLDSRTVGRLDSEPVDGGAVSGRERKKKVAAGRRRSVVTHKGDRKAIRVEVRRLIALGLSQTEACRQVADQAGNGRSGEHSLTTKYNIPGITWAVVRRVYLAKW